MGDWAAMRWQIRLPLPIMPRTVSVRVVQVRRSPTRRSNGIKYWVKGSFQSNSHFMAMAPALHAYPASILPQPGKRIMSGCQDRLDGTGGVHDLGRRSNQRSDRLGRGVGDRPQQRAAIQYERRRPEWRG